MQFLPSALDFIIVLVSSNELIVKKIGEKISLMDESTLEQLNKLMDIEVEQAIDFKEIDNNEDKFYAIALNLLKKKKKTWLEMQIKHNQKSLNNEENVNEIKLQKKNSFSSNAIIETYKVFFLLIYFSYFIQIRKT